MFRALLTRHASFDGVGVTLAGRDDAVSLNREGRAQADTLAQMLRNEAVAAVYTSPLPRAQQTAHAIAIPHGLLPIDNEGFLEIDFGGWTGRAVTELEGDGRWYAFNTLRSVTAPPNGELMLAAQARAVSALLELRQQHDGTTVVIVTHADVIRAVCAYLLGMPVDFMLRLNVPPASVTALSFNGGWPLLEYLARLPGGDS